MKPSYFISEPTLAIEWLAFRKQTKLSKSKQEQIKAYAEKVVEHQAWLQSTFYPKQPRPSRNRLGAEPPKTRSGRHRDSERIGDLETLPSTVSWRWLRTRAASSSVPGAGRANSMGCRETLDGRPVDRREPGTHVDRCRYNVAHELGHFLTSALDISEKDAGIVAHRFAASLLVPASVALQELGEKRRHVDFGELGVLKQKYGLSMQAWVRRAKDLEIISESKYKSLCIEFSSRGWRQREPFGYQGHEEPKKLVQMTRRAVAEGIISPDEANRICEGCGSDPITAVRQVENSVSPIALLRLPRGERLQRLADAAAQAEKEYRSNPGLTDFNAFGENDLHAESSSAETG